MSLSNCSIHTFGKKNNNNFFMIIIMQTTSEYLDEFKIIKLLGAGYHAEVTLAQAPDKTLVAIKKFKQSTATLSTLKHQLSIMKNLHHQNLVNLIDVRQNASYKNKDGSTQKCFAIILEYVGGGELFDFLAISGRFNQTITRTYFYQLMNAVHYMHEKGYAHRDIKPQNILLASDYRLKLADFGFATLLEGKNKSYVLHTKLGTEGYMAPEVLTKNYQGKAADIFSCGVILFIMYTACPPFEKSTPNDFYYKLIKNKQYETFWSYHSKKRPPGFFPDSFKDLVQKMLAYDPKERPTVVQISQHPWTKGKVLAIQSLKQEFDTRKATVDAENDKQRSIKQKQKEEIKTAIFNPNLVFRKENPSIIDFKELYQIEVGTTRKLQVKSELAQGDYVVNDSLDFVITTLLVYLKKTVDNKFTPQFKITGSKFDIKYTSEYEEQQKAQVNIELQLSTSSDGKVVFSFRRLEGNAISYKILVNSIQQQFSYCGHKV